ncbi:hypothetical protein [Lactococcus lactis]|uniref:hypothetical protein n=1 Tax=Lactococcus lactis TaxID=1358 RepID=UPI00223AFC9B|nr:hypothetical protein [Lactococcus lactis]MCT1174284.1 hypothetical protein [Lactococcus lactis]
MIQRGIIEFQINKEHHPEDSRLFELVVRKGIEFLNNNGYEAKVDYTLHNEDTVKAMEIVIKDSLKGLN